MDLKRFHTYGIKEHRSPKDKTLSQLHSGKVSSNREESLSDPRWHERPRTKAKKANTSSPKQPNTESATKIQDAREVITQKKVEETRKKSNFP